MRYIIEIIVWYYPQSAFLDWANLLLIHLNGLIFALEVYQRAWLKDLSIPLHVGAEDILKMLNLPNVDTLHYEVYYLSEYVDEECLFKVGLSTQARRSHAYMLKKSAKDHIQEAQDHIYDVEVKALDLECMDDGISLGFLNRVHLVQCKIGAEVEGLTSS
ncbi:hypothetical protein IEQ34_007342 [Dendrobium chrysotoxum]|uniref:GIY-YIG homing endonuclease n=1 Tax=Dendrobium chrysotoxum TaxID=161865 RepID=A0AAV7H7J7_DENCH|nr:hypothetical protein IEQ34_007342 [Dendrobium chrysotoxum]